MKGSWPVVIWSWEGVDSWFLFTSDWMISFLTVLRPMLAKRMMKIVMTIIDTSPPVVELYSVSPLYRTSLAVGNRSSILIPFEAVEKNEGIF